MLKQNPKKYKKYKKNKRFRTKLPKQTKNENIQIKYKI